MTEENVNSLRNPEHAAKLKESVHAWNEWRSANVGIEPKLCGVDLADADLSLVNLAGADLRGANLYHASLFGAQMQGANCAAADLSYADLTCADLSRTRFDGADLGSANFGDEVTPQAMTNCVETVFLGANLSKADFFRVEFVKVDFRRADLTETRMRHTFFRDCVFGATKLKGTIGLEDATRFNPSTIDHQTISKSWPVSIAFLRGCGLPDDLIEFYTTRTHEYYSCFISYSTADQPFANRLYADLQASGVRCWFAPHDILPGKKILAQIDEAIRSFDKLLMILSPASIASEWVKEEILEAWARAKRENRPMLSPIGLSSLDELRAWKCHDADTGRDVAREIREYFIPDFSTWKTDHDAYQRAFDSVVKSLAAAVPTGGGE